MHDQAPAEFPDHRLLNLEGGAQLPFCRGETSVFYKPSDYFYYYIVEA